MSGPAEGPACAHGLPQGVACQECIGEVVRRLLGAAAAREAATPTPLAASAIQSHEMLLAHVAAGFTREEAMRIVLMVYATQIFKTPPG
jgi:hypothetical protein